MPAELNWLSELCSNNSQFNVMAMEIGTKAEVLA